VDTGCICIIVGTAFTAATVFSAAAVMVFSRTSDGELQNAGVNQINNETANAKMGANLFIILYLTKQHTTLVIVYRQKTMTGNFAKPVIEMFF